MVINNLLITIHLQQFKYQAIISNITMDVKKMLINCSLLNSNCQSTHCHFIA
jgi:hypothetical protein